MLAETAVNILQKLKHWHKKKKSLDVLKESLSHKLTAVLKKSQTSPFEAYFKIHCLSEGIQSLFTQIPTAHIHLSAFSK